MSSSVPLQKPTAMSPEDWRLLIEGVQDYAIFMLDPEGNVATWNRGAEAIKGYTAAEIIGSHFSRFYPAEELAAGTPTLELKIAREVGRVEQEGFRLRKDGSRFWANVVITALRDESGTLRGFTKVTRDLSARRAADEELRRSEERFRLLMEGVTDCAIYMLDPSGYVTTWNVGAEKIKGYRAAEIVGKNFSLFFPVEDVRSGRPQRELTMALSEGHFAEEGFRVRKDGSRFWASVVVTPMRDSRGEHLGFAKVTRDLTARLEHEQNSRRLLAEQAAREAAEAAEVRVRASEQRYRSLSVRLEVILEGLADGVAAQDRTGKLVFANRAGAYAMGYPSVEACMAATPQELADRYDLLDESGRPIERDSLPGRRVLLGEPAVSMLVHVCDRVSGEDWWRLLKATGVMGPDGRTELAIYIFHDVTEARRREQHESYLAKASAALAESLDYSATLATLANLLVPDLGDWCAIHLLEGEQLEAVVVSHVDPQKVSFAREVDRKYPPDPGQPRGVWNVLRTGNSELYTDFPDALLAQGARDAEHLAILRAVGMQSALVVPIRMRKRVLGTLSLVSSSGTRRFNRHDLSLAEELGRRAGNAVENARLYAAQKKAREDLALLAKAAEQANRLKDEFLATVSHELRTPLNAILGWASLLRARSTEPAAAKPIEIIHRNAQAQSKIIEDILDASRIITGKLRLELKLVDLRQVLQDALEVLRPSTVAKNLTVELTPNAEPCLLVADPERLQQVAWNVLSNAVKFSKAGGTITVSVARESSALVLTVQDTGRGIAPEFLPFVFDRFQQADGSTTRRVGGLGLGLAIVRQLVELHGGHVEAWSAGLDQGATFRIFFPIRAVATAAHETESGATTPAAAHERQRVDGTLAGTRVLVVDDEEDARELLAVVLADAGATVECAASAAEAIATLQRFRPHVLVSDIGMPDEDGYSLMQRVQTLSEAHGGRIPAIALTAYTRQQDQEKALAAGFTTHLGKPVNTLDLVAAVATLSALARTSSAQVP